MNTVAIKARLKTMIEDETQWMESLRPMAVKENTIDGTSYQKLIDETLDDIETLQAAHDELDYLTNRE
jgi:hypothetical protein